MLGSINGKLVGFTAGCFDVGPHAGHLIMLEEAKANCEYLIVGLQVDPSHDRPETKRSPIPSLSERYLALAACKYVDEIIPYESEAELVNLIHLILPDVRFLGSDYTDKTYTGMGIEGVRIHFCNRSHNLSSTTLRKKILSAGMK